MRKGREHSSVPIQDTSRISTMDVRSKWSPTSLEIFDHYISVDITTGNLSIQVNDLKYPYYGLPFAISRSYDVQEQYMQLTYLRNYPNVNPRPNWFGNWKFGFEVDVEDVWKKTCSEIQITSPLNTNGLFYGKAFDFKRNHISKVNFEQILRTYGIPGRTTREMGWDFATHDFILRSNHQSFEVLTGHYLPETLVDDSETQLWLFHPINGNVIKISSDFYYNLDQPDKREVGFESVIKKYSDALGHHISLNKGSENAPYEEYNLTDGSGRNFKIETKELFKFYDANRFDSFVHKKMVSRITDETRNNNNVYVYSYKNNKLLETVSMPGINGTRVYKYHYHDKFPGIISAIENSKGDKILFIYTEDSTDNDDRLNPRLKIAKIIDPEGIEFLYEYNYSARRTKVIVRKNQIDVNSDYGFIVDVKDTKKRLINYNKVEVSRGYILNNDSSISAINSSNKQIIETRKEFSNDGHFNVVKEVDPMGRERKFEYNDFNQLKVSWDYRNHWTKYYYDNPNERTRPTTPSPSNPFRYDLLRKTVQNVLRTKDPVDPSKFINQPVEVIERFEWTTYNAANSEDNNDSNQSTHRLYRRADEEGNIWTHFYDDAQNNNPTNPTRIMSPLGISTRMTYNTRGSRISTIDAEGNVHIYKFDVQSRLIESADPNGSITKFIYYDGVIWLDKIEDPLNGKTELKRDIDGNITQVIDAIGDVVDYVYYRNERLHKIIKHRNRIPVDPQDNSSPSIISEYTNLEYEFDYSPFGKLKYLKNPKGLVYRADYDEADRIYQWYHELQSPSFSKFVYNPASQLIAEVDKNGRTIIIDYYNLSGLTRQIMYPAWSDGNQMVAGKVVTIKEYDFLENPLTVHDSELLGSTEHIFDLRGNLVLRRDSDGYELRFEFDEDNRFWKSIDKDGYFKFIMKLDRLSRPTIITDSDILDGPLSWNYEYQKNQPSGKKVLNLFKISQALTNLVFNYDYDAKNRLTDIIIHWDQSQEVFKQHLTFKQDDLLNSITGDNSNEYKYDSLKQLIFEKAQGLSCDFDRAGNRKYRVDLSQSAAPNINVYDETNKLIDEKSIAESYTYDSSGNLTLENSSTRQFYFDGQGCLRKVINPGKFRIDYLYDHVGKLRKRRFEDLSLGNVETIDCIYFQDELIIIKKQGQLDTVFTRDIYGHILRIRKPGISLSSQLGNSAFPIQDFMYNINKIVAQDKTELSSISYDAYGNILSSVDPQGVSKYIGYKTGIYDEELEFVLFGLRWYNPLIGRWISADPLANSPSGEIFTELSNFYLYSNNNPITFEDPSGLQPRFVPRIRMPAGRMGRGTVPKSPNRGRIIPKSNKQSPNRHLPDSAKQKFPEPWPVPDLMKEMKPANPLIKHLMDLFADMADWPGIKQINKALTNMENHDPFAEEDLGIYWELHEITGPDGENKQVIISPSDPYST